MEAIILAGGFGTRLKDVLKDRPKPMAIINGTPFLEILIRKLKKSEIDRIILAVGYKSEVIMSHFKNSFEGIEIVYSVEDEPLGTGGAIKKAANLCQSTDIIVLNGDTYFDCDLVEMNKIYTKSNCDITLALKRVQNNVRYGTVKIHQNKIIDFNEKKYQSEGFINAGTYVINKNVFSSIELNVFSFEKILESKVFSMCAYESEGFFIDIGIPEDYMRAQDVL